jgi:hypothetical protein
MASVDTQQSSLTVKKMNFGKILLGQFISQQFLPFGVDIHFLLHALTGQGKSIGSKNGHEFGCLLQKDRLSTGFLGAAKRVVHIPPLNGRGLPGGLVHLGGQIHLVHVAVQIGRHSFCREDLGVGDSHGGGVVV